MAKCKDLRKPALLDLPLPQDYQSNPDNPNLDRFAAGPLTEIIYQFRDRLLQEAKIIAGEQGKSVVDANHLEQAYGQLLSIPTPKMWDMLNRYRVYLIQKELTEGLTAAETVDLEMLQTEADRCIKAAAPRPLKELRDLKQKLMADKKKFKRPK